MTEFDRRTIQMHQEALTALRLVRNIVADARTRTVNEYGEVIKDINALIDDRENAIRAIQNKPKKRRHIVAVDFDGTLCEGDNYPEIGKPNLAVIRYILRKKAEGAVIILHTCRAGKPLEDAVEWCAQQGIIFDAVNENVPETLEWLDAEAAKIYADEYIDDRAVNVKDIKEDV